MTDEEKDVLTAAILESGPELVREFVTLGVQAYLASQAEDVSFDQIDRKMQEIEAKNEEAQAIIAKIRERRAAG